MLMHRPRLQRQADRWGGKLDCHWHMLPARIFKPLQFKGKVL